jgi:hypothetical protein
MNYYIKVIVSRPGTNTSVQQWYIVPRTLPNGELVSMELLGITVESIRDAIEEEFPGWDFKGSLCEQKEYLEFSSFGFDFA